MAGKPRTEVVARAELLLDQVGVREIADHLPSEASGGQLQRVGIARALINQPTLVFGDEPTGALNRSTATQVLDLLGDVQRNGTTVVLVTHDPLVAARADRLIMLVDGHITDDLALGSYTTATASERIARVSELMQQRGT